MLSNQMNIQDYEQIQLEGVIRPMNWDKLGLVKGFIFSSTQGEDYPILNTKSIDFTDFLDQRVRIQGEVNRTEAGISILKITKIVLGHLGGERTNRVAKIPRSQKRPIKFNEQTHVNHQFRSLKKNNVVTYAHDTEFEP